MLISLKNRSDTAVLVISKDKKASIWMSYKKRFRPLDWLILVASISLVAGSIIFFLDRSQSDELYVEVDSQEANYLVPLWEDKILTLHGPVGETVVNILNNEAYVLKSDCRDKICIAMGHISEVQQWIACLPNKVFVKIVPLKQDKELQLDSSVY